MNPSLALRLCLTLVFSLVTLLVHAQGYPQRALKLIVPFAAGGTTDALGRTLSSYLGERLGQAVVVENRSGGGGSIGAEAGARSAPDGYTLLLGSVESYGMTNADVKRLNYNPEKDLVAVAMVSRAPNVLIVHPSVRANTLQELVEFARANPGKIRYGTPGIGTNVHVIVEMLKHRTEIDLVHVPYKGGGAAINDLISGQIEMLATSVVTSTGHVKSGKARALALTGGSRASSLPDVPTMAEAGYDGFVLGALFGVFVPAGTPGEPIARLTQELLAVKKNPEFLKRLDAIGQQIAENLVGDAFGRFMAAEARRWREMAAIAGMKD